jgi:HEAT repeat protein
MLKRPGGRGADYGKSAAAALARIGPKAVPPLIETLSSPNTAARTNAALALGTIGQPAHAASASLQKLLTDKEESVRLRAAQALWDIDHETKLTLPVLIGLLTHETHWANRNAAMNLLARIGPQAREAVPALTQALKEESMEVRRTAAVTLGQIGPDASAAVPTLRSMLQDPEKEAAEKAAVALEKITGEKTAVAGPGASSH